MSKPKLFLRIKRENQTFCLLCDNGETVKDIKRYLSMAATQHHPTVVDDMKLTLPDNSEKALQDSDTMESLGLKDDSVLYVSYAIAENEYEKINIASTSLEAAS